MTDQADMEARAREAPAWKALIATIEQEGPEYFAYNARRLRAGFATTQEKLVVRAMLAYAAEREASAYARAAEVCDEHGPLHCEVKIAIEALGEKR